MPFEERKAIRGLRPNSDIVIKKGDKGTTTCNNGHYEHKSQNTGGSILPDDKNNWMPLATPVFKETARKTSVIIDDLHQGNHIAKMTKK